MKENDDKKVIYLSDYLLEDNFENIYLKEFLERDRLSFIDKEWYQRDLTEEMQGTPAIGIYSYFDELEEDDEVCSFFLNDINFPSQLDNVELILNAPSMFRLLLKAEKHLPEELRTEWEKIKENF